MLEYAYILLDSRLKHQLVHIILQHLCITHLDRRFESRELVFHKNLHYPRQRGLGACVVHGHCQGQVKAGEGRVNFYVGE